MDINSIGAFGTVPFLNEEVIKKKKFKDIKTQAGKIAYLMSLGKKAKKPHVKEGVYEAKGALKWIAAIMEDDNNEE